ncbi:cellulose biosynthesis cyclic di-GMP-binding regulatory protein BcsB [Methylorubrum extorquens]|uniref:Cyclic di-GMP-binding protein n=1 Tax=Methylorubrum extorquens TaxID=408 RepID=A0AAX3WKN9_METEX|nr:cellulose biosynthesis cyclic di-GMP-binding regulatory protein BcsB [Methylorubrum extorquens]KQO98035.1 cellulose synthase [Methylobacterium sp. Leaf92]WHQ71451.1 cellulose biosynthesis cyclic di-GMP-binding regulatory protein BcsB [Methylorubrum extorquens]
MSAMAVRPLPRAGLGAARWATGAPALALVCALMGGLPARAQSFLGTGPAERLTVPPTGDALRKQSPAPAQAPARAPTSSAPPTPTAQGRPSAPDSADGGRRPQIQATIAPARRLPAGTRGFRLSGEEDVLQYPVYLTEGQARGAARLRVSYLSAISVAPEGSELTGLVNGTKVGWTRIQAPGAVKVVEFAIPDGVLKAGYNAVTLTASQRHRVDCAIEATYELWTQIDPSRSGLVIAPAADLDLKSLAALEPDESGALPMGVLLNEKPTLPRLERMIGAVQALAVVSRLARPAVSFGPPLAGRSGVNLLVGTAAEIRGTDGVEDLGPITGPRLALLPPRGNRAPTLVVTGLGPDDVRAATAQLAAAGDAGGTGPGTALAPLIRGYEVQGGERLELQRLGVTSREFNGRLLRTRIELRFPPDFVPADYGKAMLHLAGGYAAGLDSSAQIVVDINGRNAASVPLPYARGEVFDDQAIPLPLSLWRPGLNSVEISAQLPNAADKVCDTLSPAARQPRFLFLDRTRLEIPSLARAVRSPDLAAVKAGAVPFTAPGPRPRLVLPVADRETADAAATLAARLAIAAKRVIDFELVPDAGGTESGAKLVVAPARALNPVTIQEVGLDPEEIRRIWGGRAETVATPGQFGPEGVLTLDRLRRNLPMRCALPPAAVPVSVAAAPPAASTAAPAAAAPAPRSTPRPAAPETDEELVARWDQTMSGAAFVPSVLREGWTRLANGALRLRSGVTGLIAAPTADVPVNPRASLIIAEDSGGTRLGETTVLVTAPNPSMLKASVSCLVDPVVWTRLVGRAAFLDASDGTLTTVQPDRVALIETRSWSLANFRLVSAAWLSLNPGYYVGMTLFMALCLGLATTGLVRQLGRRNS